MAAEASAILLATALLLSSALVARRTLPAHTDVYTAAAKSIATFVGLRILRRPWTAGMTHEREMASAAGNSMVLVIVRGFTSFSMESRWSWVHPFEVEAGMDQFSRFQYLKYYWYS